MLQAALIWCSTTQVVIASSRQSSGGRAGRRRDQRIFTPDAKRLAQGKVWS
jgi:hypothetical protein